MYQYIPDPFVNYGPARPRTPWQRLTRRCQSLQAQLGQKRRSLRRRYRRWLNGGIDGDWVCPYPFMGWSCPKWLPWSIKRISWAMFFVWMNREDEIWQEGRLRARGIEPAPVQARERFARLFHRPSFRR